MLRNVLISMRPKQWTKNLLVFAGLMFGGRLTEPWMVLRAVVAFGVFCLLSGVVYIVNDLNDAARDREHPTKRFRPIAAGRLSIREIVVVVSILTLITGSTAGLLGSNFGLIAISYIVLFSVYSLYLKHVVILDVLTIATGFVLRAVAGAVVVNVAIGHWLIVCTVLLATFIGLAKRRHEIVYLKASARPVLSEYSVSLLDQMIAVVAPATLLAYVLYTVSPETVEKFHTTMLVWTIPFPLYGIFRYLYLVHQKHGGGSPADDLLGDRPLFVCILLWGLTVGLIIYGR
jgi:4-hydroxybenzoate polyprenyltransferase